MTGAPKPRQPEDRPRCSRTRFLAARPSDRMLALSTAPASLPVIGRHLQPLGSVAAMGLWGARHLQDLLVSSANAWLTPGIGAVRRREREQTNAVSESAVRAALPVGAFNGLDLDWPAPERTPPVWKAWQHRRHLYRTSVRYGSAPEQTLDVWRRRDLPTRPAPVLIFVPGGAWVHGSRALQGYALLSHLAEQGWVCLSIDYRVAPHHRWPRHIIDVKTAIAWARANVDKYGGDRDFIAIAGCSAGGHLAALAGLTGRTGEFADELPDGADASVDAVVSVYGRYDWQDRSTAERRRFVDFLERVVVAKTVDRHPAVFRDASPIARVHHNAPAFLVVHGSNDIIIPVQQARDFVDRLRAVSASEVGYLELPGAGHGFDMTDGVRTGATTTAIGLFLNQIHRSRSRIGAKRVI